LKEIAKLIAKRKGVLLSPQGAKMLAAASQGLPYRVEHLLTLLAGDSPDAKKCRQGVAEVSRFLRIYRYDVRGLTSEQSQYMLYLDRAGTASRDTLAARLGTDTADLVEMEEPLIRMGLVARIVKIGRRLTPEGERVVAELKERNRTKMRTKTKVRKGS
jgi:DNA-binding MarR family transcriptional regulator